MTIDAVISHINNHAASNESKEGCYEITAPYQKRIWDYYFSEIWKNSGIEMERLRKLKLEITSE